MNIKDLKDWIQGPCVSCTQKVAMPSLPVPDTLHKYLTPLTGPNEQHEISQKEHNRCINPKCRAPLTPHAQQDAEWDGGWYTCPECGFKQNLFAGDPGLAPDTMIYQPASDGSKYTLNPGGVTHAGLTLKEMGDIGENLILRIGEIPGVGAVKSASDSYTYAIDAVAGPFGIEIKTNHSQATPIFKIGGREERQQKIKYCLSKGLKPALIGVRLNFFTDLAYVFFREGLTDTAISNTRMKHVGTFNFKDLNPFQSPDPQIKAMMIEKAKIPDQATGEDEFKDIFGSWKASGSDFEQKHPRGDAGKFTVPKDVHELKVTDEKGKEQYSVKRCKHCGVTYKRPTKHKGRMECPSCGEDPERKLAVARVTLAAVGENKLAQELGWGFVRHSSTGKPVYSWTDPNSFTHIVTGHGDHGKSNLEMAHRNTQKRMQNCMGGLCAHADMQPDDVPTIDDPGSPVLRGQTVVTPGGDYGLVQDIDGNVTVIRNFASGKTERVPSEQLQAVARDQ